MMDSRVKRRTGNEKINVKEAIEIIAWDNVRDDKKLLHHYHTKILVQLLLCG